MDITRIDDDLSVTGQISPRDVGALAAAAKDIEAAARAAGLEFAHVPVASPAITAESGLTMGSATARRQWAVASHRIDA